jgi:hypothetical protein
VSIKSAGLCPVFQDKYAHFLVLPDCASFGGVAGKESFLTVLSFLVSLGMTVLGLGVRERLLTSLEVEVFPFPFSATSPERDVA